MSTSYIIDKMHDDADKLVTTLNVYSSFAFFSCGPYCRHAFFALVVLLISSSLLRNLCFSRSLIILLTICVYLFSISYLHRFHFFRASSMIPAYCKDIAVATFKPRRFQLRVYKCVIRSLIISRVRYFSAKVFNLVIRKPDFDNNCSTNTFS